MTPLANITVSVSDEGGNPLPNLFYLDSNGAVDTSLKMTSSSGGFVFFALQNSSAASIFTVTAADSTTTPAQILARRSLPIYTN